MSTPKKKKNERYPEFLQKKLFQKNLLLKIIREKLSGIFYFFPKE